ncbi:hypothetical protein [uncultured Brachyspira sp.]|uniref:hypothetical protein n=1 Tax=uncultured Brachyspira sp. TaxID=221953 RepID=UPI002638B35E|nr:hypothetical protein [uncultured Brachyspira sp.]
MSKLKEFEIQSEAKSIKGCDMIAVRIPKEIRENALKYNMTLKEYIINVHKFYLAYLKENKK